MKLLVDRNIPLAEELFGSLGEVTLADGRKVDETFPHLPAYDVMAIRSVTKVTPALIDCAVNLKAIGTATIGTDHIDMDYIRRANGRREHPVAVFSAPGSNADSVADYVWYALCHLTRDAERPLGEMSLGIVGFGNCGSRVGRRASGFGMRVLRCDPPLSEREPEFVSHSLEQTLSADFVTLHVPLTEEGESEHPTCHMIGAAELERMGESAWLLNSSRGAVVDSSALAGTLRDESIGGAVLDVYEGEPEPPRPLVELPELATPHIAGYAVEGKRRGAVMIYLQICEELAVEPVDTSEMLTRGFQPPAGLVVNFPARRTDELSADEAVRALLAEIHDVAAASRELKQTLDSQRRGALFDAMRRNYEEDYGRHELSAYRLGFGSSVGADLRDAIGRRLECFGVGIDDREPHYVLMPL